MALVSYEYSGSENEEEGEEEEETTSSVIINKKQPLESPEAEETLIGKLLPQVKAISQQNTEEKLEDFIPKYQPSKERVKEKVKITIPSLSQFEEDPEPETKRSKINSSKGSGLLTLLPPVKGSPLSTKSFVPKIVAQKKTNSTNSSLVPNAVRKKAEVGKKAVIQKIMTKSDDLESDDDIELPETFDEEMWTKVCGRPKKGAKTVSEPPKIEPMPIIDAAPEPVKPYDGLDNAAFKELVGKNRRPHMNYKLVDVNEEEILADKDLWLTKSLTDPDQDLKAQLDDHVDPTRKKKHHITFLAEQAKANEQELQSTWSANKYTRNQTRAKYGF